MRTPGQDQTEREERAVAASVGATVRFRKTMTVAEQAMFTGISGNLDGLHVDRRRAVHAGFSDVVVFELAAASLLTTCLSRIAGPDFRIAQFETEFGRTICVGETVEAEARLLSREGGRLEFALSCRAGGKEFCTGRAVLVPACLR